MSTLTRFRAVFGTRTGAIVAVGVVAATLSIGLSLPASASPATARPGGSVSGGASQPIYDYTKAIHQSVRVNTTMDTDGDGKPDTVAVDIIRPSETVAAGIKVPVIMDASPYFTCCGRGNESQLKTYDSHGVIAQMPLYYDNYFVPRGYAEVGVDILGTGKSTGCGDLGGKNEIASITAVIDWLNGRNTAKNVDGTTAVADWTTGAVGMIGKSYDGTLANGVAATGIAGLKTIVPISAIDSWYDYTRSGGVVYSDNYPSYLTGYVGRTDGVCDAYRNSLDTAADDATGNYNAFWADRDYLKDVNLVKASVFESHGVNDTNVETKHMASWWAGLSANNVPRKLWLSQEGHVDPFDYNRAAFVDELHEWFDYWLLGVPNGVMSEPQVTVEHSPNVFGTDTSWPVATTSSTAALGSNGLGGTASGTKALTDNTSLTEATILSSPRTAKAGRLVFTSAPLTADARLSGTPTVTLRIKVNKTDTPITARLIDYGNSSRPVGEGVKNATTSSCWGSSSTVDSACYLDVLKNFSTSSASVLSRGWLDAAHYPSISTPTPLVSGQWRTVTIPLRAQDDILARGHQLGLDITLSDTEYTTPNSTGATVTIDLTSSVLNLPVVGGITLTPGTAPAIATATSTAETPNGPVKNYRIPQA
ncbi:MAG: Xaa-Pro dipeptidyl-peptidase [Actinomycetota bacterium]|nr:Xaa-Pro dipeptidyl-peptidase [Actinomycetota bacterium]MDQ2957811.1 Xaa-Pro dipeptidyl-peptidase [Actinomycetota bacterium]